MRSAIAACPVQHVPWRLQAWCRAGRRRRLLV